MERTDYQLRIEFTTPLLGTQPQKDVASEWLAGKVEKVSIDGSELVGEIPPDELDTLPEALEKATTGFHRLSDGMPILYDYQLKGFLKESGLRFNGTRNVKNLRSKISSFVFVFPRQLKLMYPSPDTAITYLERPLRAMTAQGPRIALARSEMLPEGVSFECTLTTLNPIISFELLKDLLDYGAFEGIGQWRGGSWGRFTYQLMPTA